MKKKTWCVYSSLLFIFDSKLDIAPTSMKVDFFFSRVLFGQNKIR